jgi:hypothetical protein
MHTRTKLRQSSPVLQRSARRPWLLPSLAGLAAAVGLVLLAGALLGRAPVSAGAAPGGVAEADGLRLAVERVAWVAHHPAGSGAPMPMPMPMPDMPAPGAERLLIEVRVENPGEGWRTVTPAEFRLAAAAGTWPVRMGSLVPGGLGPGQAVAGLLYFDLPRSDMEPRADLRLVWSRGGRDTALALGPAAHGHSGDSGGERRTP